MGKASRDKGATFEREVANRAKAKGLTAYRTAQLQAGRIPGAADVVIEEWPELHVEAKRDERLSVDAMVRQADAAAAARGQEPVVVYRRNRQPSRAVVRWEFLLDLLTRGRS